VRELALEVALSEIPLSNEIDALLQGLLNRLISTDLFQLRSEGFLMLCRVFSHSELEASLAKNQLRHVTIKVVGREKSCAEVVQISGTWRGLFPARHRNTDRLIHFLESLKGKPIYIEGSPSFHSKALRVTILADEEVISDVLEEMNSADLTFKVLGLGSRRASRNSPLTSLTARQASILRLAHSLGYFDIPKRTGVADLSRMLEINNATVGEHLQRAEKNVLDWLLL